MGGEGSLSRCVISSAVTFGTDSNPAILLGMVAALSERKRGSEVRRRTERKEKCNFCIFPFLFLCKCGILVNRI